MQPWLRDHTIFLTIHGSQSFGMATASSDLDIKGVCIPPDSVRQHLFQGFEQAENPPLLQEDYGHLANPANPKIEGVVYELSKYIKLAAVTNPTIVELLWVDPKFILKTTPVWELLRANRQMFVSRKAKHGYIGYAAMQFSKIERHRKWLRLDKEPERPTRENFGLKAGEPTREYGEAERYIKRQVELWNLSTFELDADARAEVKEMCWDLLTHLNQASHIDWATWPEAYYNAALVKLQNSIQMPKEILGLIAAEKRYQDALKEWQGYQRWKNERNAGRKELEVKHGYDCYSHDTEFLTENGWMFYDQIGENTKLATAVKGNHTVEYQNFTERFEGSFTGNLYHFTGTHTDILVTPNHNMWNQPREKNNNKTHTWRLTQAAQLTNCFDILRTITPKYKFYKNTTLPLQQYLPAVKRHNLLRLMGWYVAEGSLLIYRSKKKKKAIRVKGISLSQLKGGRVHRQIAKVNSSDPQLYAQLREYTHFRKSKQRWEMTWNLYNQSVGEWFKDNCGNYSRQKRLPRFVFKLCKREMVILLDALIAGDGTHRPLDNSQIYNTNSKQLADDIHELAFLCGFESSKWGPYSKGMYQIHINRTRGNTKILTRSKNIHKMPAVNHRIVCFSVPNGLLITRRNGRIAIQGNSKHASHLVRLVRSGLELMHTGDLSVLRPDASELLAIRNGAWPYEKVVEYATTMEEKFNEAEKTSPMPKNTNKEAINDLYQEALALWAKTAPAKLR